MNWFRFLLVSICCFNTSVASAADLFLGQGTMSGEVTKSTALLQTRLTQGNALDENGDMPGALGIVGFEYSLNRDFSNGRLTPFQETKQENDYIVRTQLKNLIPSTRYYYRINYGTEQGGLNSGPICSFKTLPSEDADQPVRFIVGSCMNYIKFMHGKRGNAGGPLTATKEDKQLGFPAFETMRKIRPDFFVGTGDIVYYDNKFRRSETVPELRRCWHEQFRFQRMIDFFQDVPTYWSKDDHDFRFNDSDNASKKLPLSKTGIQLFREQLPIAPQGDDESPTYRTYRVNKHLQIWMTEGRDYRSPNRMKDGPDKTLWGSEQLTWLKSTLKASDAKWKILISPTPMVGPDDAKKRDNHANLKGFRHEANAFFDWLNENKIENLMTVCGDRHWQYHSIHPSGVEEFACGALNDENARYGVEPGNPKGTDPDSLIKQPFISPKPSGGFLLIEAGSDLEFKFHTAKGKLLYTLKK